MKIGLLWHSLSSGNLGVRALTQSHIDIVTRIVHYNGRVCDIVLIGPRQPDDVTVSDYTYVELTGSVRSIANYYRVINSCDFILDIGSGDSFSDIYGAMRGLKILLSKWMIKDKSNKLILSPQTIGPFNNRLFRMMSVALMERSKAVFCRDPLSENYVKSLSSTISLNLAFDVAMDLKPDASTDVRALCGDVEASGSVGLNVSGLLFFGGYSNQNQFGLSIDYPKFTRSLIKSFQDEGIEVFLVPHVTHQGSMSGECDLVVSRLLEKEFNNVIVVDGIKSPAAAKAVIASFDFFIAARMHAAIAAFSSGVPVIPLAYSRKFKGLFDSCDYNYVKDLRANSSEETILTEIMNVFRDRAKVKSEMVTSINMAHSKLDNYKAYLKQLFAEERLCNDDK